MNHFPNPRLSRAIQRALLAGAFAATVLLAPAIGQSQPLDPGGTETEIEPIENVDAAQTLLGEEMMAQLEETGFDFDDHVLLIPTAVNPEQAETLHVVVVADGDRLSYQPAIDMRVTAQRDGGELKISVQKTWGPCMSGPVPPPGWLEECQDGAAKRRAELNKIAFVVMTAKDGLEKVIRKELPRPPPPP